MPRPSTGLAYLTFGFVFLGSFVSAVFLIIPQWSVYQSEERALLAEEAERDERKKFLADLDARGRELEQYAEDARALSVMLPEQIRGADILASLQSIAAQSGVTISKVSEPQEGERKVAAARTSDEKQVSVKASSTVQPSAAPAASGPQEWKTTVTVRGTYAQFRAFLRELEKSLVFSDVQAINMGSVTDPEGLQLGLLETSIMFFTYDQS